MPKRIKIIIVLSIGFVAFIKPMRKDFIDLEVEEAIENAQKTRDFKGLLELRGTLDVYSEILIEKALVKLMEELFSSDSLKESCLKTVAHNYNQYDASAIANLPYELRAQIENIYKENNELEKNIQQKAPKLLAFYQSIKKKKIDQDTIRQLICSDFFTGDGLKSWEDITFIAKMVGISRVRLVKQLILNETDFSKFTFYSSYPKQNISLHNKDDVEAFLLLTAAGIKEKILFDHHKTLLNYLSNLPEMKNSIDILHYLKERGYKFDLLTKPEFRSCTALETAFYSNANFDFVCFLIDEAQEQHINLKDLVGKYLLNPWSGKRLKIESIIFEFLSNHLNNFTEEFSNEFLNDYLINHARYIEEIFKFAPLVKIELSRDGKTLLDLIKNNKVLAENKNIVKLFSPDDQN